MFPPKIYDLYKRLRKSVSDIAREDSLRVIWAYTQYLQNPDLEIPADIEVDRRFYEREFKRAWINEWGLMLLAKEVLLHSGVIPRKDASLRRWNTLADTMGKINELENEIYGAYAKSSDVLVELIRIAHRTFEWQGNGPNARTIIRYNKILDTEEISQICRDRYGISVYELMACCTALLGHFSKSHVLRFPLTSQIAQLPIERFNAVLALTAKEVSVLKSKLKAEQEYNESFAYAYNSLRSSPIILMCSGTSDVAVCPIPTLLFWRYTSGLYYDLISVPEFANLFGDAYQAYVGEVLREATPSLKIYDERVYKVGSREKRSVDWIVSDQKGAALFIECKVKRMRLDTKLSLTDTSSLEEDIAYMASAVVQTYRTIQDCIGGHYPHFQIDPDVKVYPCIVTLENWHMHGPVMYGFFRDQVKRKMAESGLPNDYITRMPYSIWPIDDFELGLQVMEGASISQVMDGKLQDSELQEWEWRPYLSQKFQEPRKRLFEEHYRKMFSEFRSA